ncbi:MAG: aromatic ring-hydroxylating dioxygenase subunit alpha [Rhodospirillaceae bacterium]|nr:MAG: aromatic ring-hydroxylating dioxygenase subunit alpha [Rhodospirillaceae bacterium]
MKDRLHVPRERYFDRGFFELEKERLWSRTWQMACRLEEIPEPNDFTEYEILDQSILVVRQQDGSIKAFFNACRHRATQLERGAGRLAGGKFVCPFHGWQWNADGTNRLVYGKTGFAPECLRPDDLKLRECRAETWGGIVWINMDPNAGPLRDALHPIAGKLDEVGIEHMRVKWWKEVILNANWKMAQEAFLEGYHVMQTHPQLTMGMGESYPADTGADYLVYENGHACFQRKDMGAGGFATVDQMLGFYNLLAQGMDAQILDRDIHVLETLRNNLKPGEDVMAASARVIREYNEATGIPMPAGAELKPLYWGGDAFVFPNVFFLPYYSNVLAYRIRPYNNDPEMCRFDVWSLTTYPESHPPVRAKLLGRFDKEDADRWGLIPRQDFSNIERQQRGLHTKGYEGHRLSTEWEGGIANMHFELDRLLSRE